MKYSELILIIGVGLVVGVIIESILDNKAREAEEQQMAFDEVQLNAQILETKMDALQVKLVDLKAAIGKSSMEDLLDLNPMDIYISVYDTNGEIRKLAAKAGTLVRDSTQYNKSELAELIKKVSDLSANWVDLYGKFLQSARNVNFLVNAWS